MAAKSEAKEEVFISDPAMFGNLCLAASACSSCNSYCGKSVKDIKYVEKILKELQK
jgi:hypothetical protein